MAMIYPVSAPDVFAERCAPFAIHSMCGGGNKLDQVLISAPMS
jgi:hypothetical protein